MRQKVQTLHRSRLKSSTAYDDRRHEKWMSHSICALLELGYFQGYYKEASDI